MAFVNEYVSEENVKKFSLEEIIFRFSPEWRSPGIPPEYRFSWTVDRERNIYLMRIKTGRDDISNRSYWVLSYQGEEIKVQIDRAQGGSHTFNENPYKMIWELVKIEPDHIPGVVTKNEIISTLKEALVVYGQGGARRQVPNTIVEFNF